MGQLEGHLLRQAVAILLHNRRFHRATRPALDILTSLMETVLLFLWRRAGRVAELQGVATAAVSLPLVMEELLRSSHALYTDFNELLEYEKAQPHYEEYSSVMEERGLVATEAQIIQTTRVDPKLAVIDEAKLPDVN